MVKQISISEKVDNDIIDFIKNKKYFSAYVKELIRKDINSSKEIKKTKKRNLNFEF